MKRREISIILSLGVLVVMLVTGCAYPDDSFDEGDADLAIALGGSLQDANITRTTYPDKTESQGPMTLEKLQEADFGVFAIYTENNQYAYDATASGLRALDFMFNQDVKWDGSNSRWTYEPVKYWPNDNQPADDQLPPAQGSRLHSFVSFFAYAPYVDRSTLPTSGLSSHEGIVAMTENTVESGDSYITYRNTTLLSDNSVDLLWSRQTDRYKMDGAGFTNGHVHFNFVHALSKVTINVRTLVDHATPDDDSKDYPDDVDANTRIFIKEVYITSPQLYAQANMYLAPRPASATRPYWAGRDGGFSSLTTAVHSNLRYSGTLADRADAATAKTDFDALSPGVTSTERDLIGYDDASTYFMFIPTATAAPLTVRVVYDVVTYDPNLILNNPKYYSIVENDITYSTTADFAFEPNKAYTLRLLLGLTTAKFEVTGIEDWATPIILDGVVHDPDEVTKEYDVE